MDAVTVRFRTGCTDAMRKISQLAAFNAADFAIATLFNIEM